MCITTPLTDLMKKGYDVKLTNIGEDVFNVEILHSGEVVHVFRGPVSPSDNLAHALMSFADITKRRFNWDD